MGTELVGPLEDDNMESPLIPPGFESLAAFILNRTEANQINNFSRSASAPEAQSIRLETNYDSNDNLRTSKSVRRRTWVKYNQFDSSSGDESESNQNKIITDRLPRGVIRGCETCRNCQKVMAKWHPREARRPNLEEAPVFYPSEEEFEDTLKYISSIRAKAEAYGICRIVPPPSWKPPCPLKGRDIWERSNFTTRVQRIDKLQNRYSMRKISQVNERRRKKRRCLKNSVDHGNGFQEIKVAGAVGLCEAERFGFEPGPDFSLDAFQRYADDFKSQYFVRNDIGTSMLGERWQPSVEDIEGEYWRMVEKPTEEIEVLYGADLETGSFGSGFPKTPLQVSSASDMKYIHSGWNLNNFPRLPGSVLSFEKSDISGVLVPWLYIGMCFSSFCWHVEDHHLYSLNYMHWGAPKMWYGVPASDAQKLEAAMRKHLPDLFEEQPDLLHKLVTQFSPSILRSEGVLVYRCVQNPGEFVLTFPRAYHAGFSCGFNCAEAVNVAPIDWLPYGQNAIDLYREQGRQTTISHDKLLLGAARETVKANWEYNLLRKRNMENLRWKEVCGKDGILSKVLKTRVEKERMWRESLCKSSQALKMESSFDANSERECSVCLFDLHLSAAGCHHCSPDKYACLNHAKQLCSCSWGAKFFLFRYEISELNILVEALEGKLSAVYRWARFDLGLSLSTYVSKENKQISGQMGKLSHRSQEGAPKEMTLAHTGVSAKDHVDGGSQSLTKCNADKPSFQNPKPPVVVLALEIVKASPNSISQKADISKHNSPSNKGNYLQLEPRCVTPSEDPQKIAGSSENSASQKCEAKQSSFPEKKDVILLSDDEGDKPSEESYVENGTPVKCLSVQNLVLPKNTATLSSHSNFVSTPIVTDPSKIPERLSCVSRKVEDLSNAEKHVGGLHGSSCITLIDQDQSKAMLRNEDMLGCDEGNADCGSKQKPNDDEKFKSDDGESKSIDNIATVSTSSVHQNNLDRYYREKGPRIAKVVRRINCSVEPLDFGTVCQGKFWCDSQAIYPKGFRSRVMYIDVVNPSNMCYYVSEILDAGRGGPLFMVSVEHCPSEVFIHISATRCWEMVRERVNHEIAKQHKLGRGKLPPLQPPGSLDGMEMFGFSSPAIVQVIQSMDRKHISTEYWKLRPLLQIPEQVQGADSSINLNMKCEPMGEEDTSKSNDPRVETIVAGLFKKLNLQELQSLYSLLYNKNSTHEQSLWMRLLNENINKHPR